MHVAVSFDPVAAENDLTGGPSSAEAVVATAKRSIQFNETKIFKHQRNAPIVSKHQDEHL